MKAARARRRFRAFAHTAITTLVVLIFAIVEWWIEKTVSDRSRLAGTIIEILVVLAAALAFRPIHKRVEDAIEAAFTRKKREAQAALAHLRAELTSFNDSAQLLRRVVEAIHRFDTAGCAVYLRRETYRAEASSYDVPAPAVDLDDALVVRLRSAPSPAKPQALQSAAAGSVVFPMMVGGDLIGFLAVSPHWDLEPDEEHALALFAEAVGLALTSLDPRLRADAGAAKHNLPSGLSPLIGREEELHEIAVLLERSRLVTICGPGGIGKTRIACEVALTALRDDGAWFVDLAPIVDLEHVPTAIAHVFGIHDEGGSHPVLETVARALKTKRLILLLDNCEHVIAAVSRAAALLLKDCPNLRILATSREAMGIHGEELYRLPALPVPPEEEPATAQSVMSYAAAALFVERARSVQRSFELSDENAGIVAGIVRRLDGIALAIELAAPRIKVLGLQQLDRRLDERFTLLRGGSHTAHSRHQTLHALIGWSYDLLTPSEQRVLRYSSIFRGSWSLEALEALAAYGGAPEQVFDDLAALVDKSLVGVEIVGDDRFYRLPESTRAFAAERLDEAGERDEVAARHCEFFTAVSMQHGASYWQTDSAVWLTQVRRDIQNIRAAITWSLHHGGAAAAAIAGALRWYWYILSRREGRELLERLHDETTTDVLPAHVRGLLALAAATIDYSARAVLPASQAAIVLENVDEVAFAEALTDEGIALGRAGRVREAIALFEDALSRARAAGVPRFTGWVLSMVAYWIGASHDDDRARRLFDEAADVTRACNDSWQLARLQLHRAEFQFAQGDPDAALESVREAEAVFRERHAETALCVCVLNSAAYLIELNRLDEARERALEGLELALRVDTSMPAAWAMGHLARLAAQSGDVERAARLLGYADASYAETGGAREPTEQSGYERTLEYIHGHLTQERVRELMAEGAALEQSVAVAHARAVRAGTQAAPLAER